MLAILGILPWEIPSRYFHEPICSYGYLDHRPRAGAARGLPSHLKIETDTCPGYGYRVRWSASSPYYKKALFHGDIYRYRRERELHNTPLPGIGGWKKPFCRGVGKMRRGKVGQVMATLLPPIFENTRYLQILSWFSRGLVS
jgi:hypothetical protein